MALPKKNEVLEAVTRQMMKDRERLERARNVADWGDDRRHMEDLRRDALDREACGRRWEADTRAMQALVNNPVYAVPWPSDAPDFSELEPPKPKPKPVKAKPVAEQIAEQKPYGAREIIFD